MRSVALLVIAVACGRETSTSTSTSTGTSKDARVVDAKAADAKEAENVWSHAMHHHELDRAALAKQLGGKMKDVTVVAFWASWCHPCRKELPQVDKLAAAEHDPRVAIVAVDLDTDRSAAERFIADNHLTLPVVFDPEGEIYATVFLGSHDMMLPSTVIVWNKGVDVQDGYDEMPDDQYIAVMRYKLGAHLGP